MSNRTLTALVLGGSLLAASPAWADHNSVWGAGWANMPNDIHNSAIEDDQDTFMDLVRYGDGAESVNRYADDTSLSSAGGASALGGGSAMTRGSGMGRGGRE